MTDAGPTPTTRKKGFERDREKEGQGEEKQEKKTCNPVRKKTWVYFYLSIKKQSSVNTKEAK